MIAEASAAACVQNTDPAEISFDIPSLGQPVITGVGSVVATTPVGQLAPQAVVIMELFAGEARLTHAVHGGRAAEQMHR